jgi:Glycosyl hydrolases family 2, sugar binding domain/Glycosyl hydrolases family 2, TIM barrel domain
MHESQHPNPLLERPDWRNLDGTWRFAHDDAARWQHPKDVTFDREIRVPYPPESRTSGIHDTGYHPVVWYARSVPLAPHERAQIGSRLILHFGAVDYRAKVWVNNQLVAEHEGGHTPFCADVTAQINGSSALEIVVRAEDDPHDLHQPRGKQDWQLEPHAIWYPRTTGIWQSVWIEVVPETRIGSLHWTPNLERFEIVCEAKLEGRIPARARLHVRLSLNGRELTSGGVQFQAGHARVTLALPDPGIDDERNTILWSPEHPHLIDAEVQLLSPESTTDSSVIDQIRSYTALRSVGIDGHRFTLNGHGYHLRMVLDQGYWPDSLLAASDAELRADVELTKRLGFNGARKHQKLESPRWLYWCDRLGLLVWEEMPSHYAYSQIARERLLREWLEALERDRSHPCIVAWVPFNESWGVPDLNTSREQQDYVRAIHHLTKASDPTRLCITNDGWEFVGGDWFGIHDYTHDAKVLLERYGTAEAIAATIKQPWGRALLAQGASYDGQPVVLSEFGGIALETEGNGGWGYSRAEDSATLLEHYRQLLGAAHALRATAGFCYTQLTDTFLECNGLLTERREPKADFHQIAAATRGQRNNNETERDREANPLGYSRRWFPTPNGASPEVAHLAISNASND